MDRKEERFCAYCESIEKLFVIIKRVNGSIQIIRGVLDLVGERGSFGFKVRVCAIEYKFHVYILKVIY